MMGQPGMQYGMGGQPGMMGGQQYGGMGQMGMMGAQPGMMPQQVSMLPPRAPAVEKLREKLASASTRCGFNVQGMMGIRPQQVGMQQPQGMYGMVGQGQQGMGQMGMMGGQQFGMGAQPGMLPQQVSCLVCAQCRIIAGLRLGSDCCSRA